MFGYRIGPFAHRNTVLASLLLRYYDIHQMYLLIEHSLPVVVFRRGSHIYHFGIKGNVYSQLYWNSLTLSLPCTIIIGHIGANRSNMRVLSRQRKINGIPRFPFMRNMQRLMKCLRRVNLPNSIG